ncbi:MAG TPA: 50S ribosomal protein L25/general stress protein Ctc [Longimicrobiales bacterium]|nr:50S ribosomal protein L25/general stress protein Ctc [Longimicrobiales bacterium]
MSTKATLKALRRDGSGKGVARTLRRQGRVPAVLYGRDLEPIHLSVDAREAEQLFHQISVENTIVDLAVDGDDRPYQTLVREIQTHPWKASLVHIDFLRIQEGVKVEVEVPVHLKGVPVGVRLGGGVLEQIIHDIPVRCVPANIPESFDVDVTNLELNASLHVSDLVLPEGVELRIAGDQTICAVAIPKTEEAAAAATEAAAEAGEAPAAGEAPPAESAGAED